jgi:hypothetical protein
MTFLRIRNILRSIAIVCTLAAAIVVVPNLSVFDEAPLPEISQLLKDHLVNPDVEGNAYYYLHGMSASSDKNPLQVGKAIIHTLQSKHANGELANLTETEKAALYGSALNEDDEWQAIMATTNCIPRKKNDCFEQSLAALKNIPYTQARLQTQLARYQKVIHFPHFIEDTARLDYTSPFPSFLLITKMGELSQTKSYSESGLDGLISSSQLDMGFWRRVLTDSQTLIGKMVSIASLRRDLDGLNYGIRNASALTEKQIEQLQLILAPLNREEISMQPMLIGELRFGVENWRTAPKVIPEGQSYLLWTLTQPMATANWHYRQSLKPALALDQLSPGEFYEQAQTPTPALTFSRVNPYNLGGKLSLVKNAKYTDYLGRAHDLAGIYRLLSLQVELKEIPPADWPVSIKNSRHKNPYTQKAFDYDAVTRIVSFRCFDPKDQCGIRL